MPPALYLFPVPIGDVPPAQVLPQHNILMLRDIRYFVVENIRSARRFLKACWRDIDIDALNIVELSEHTPLADVDQMLDPLEQGHSIGVISEAGCPAVADPGADIVAAAQRRGFRVVPLVGPSSIILALMASGFNGQKFSFLGYLPIEAKARQNALRDIERDIRVNRRTHIFIETPYRNNKLIDEIIHTLSADTRLCVASDITGPRESIITKTVAQWRTQKYDYSKIPTIFLLYS